MQSVPRAGRPLANNGSPQLRHSSIAQWGELLEQLCCSPQPAALSTLDDGELGRLVGTCLGLVQQVREARDLARLLQGDDPLAVALCERALWASWFQAAGPEAATMLHRAMELSANGRTDEALAVFDTLIERYAAFAEAYHQRGMTHSLREDHGSAIEDFFRAVQLNPIHFSALANLGHCCVEVGRFKAAREWYLAALRAHPRMTGVRQVLRRLRELNRPGTPLPA